MSREEFFKIVPAKQFFTKYCPGITNYYHKLRGYDGNKKQIDFTALAAITPEQRITYIKDLLGILEFSPRTFTALTNAKSDLPQFFTLAVCSPEFVVNA